MQLEGKPSHVILFAIVFGLVAYLASALWCAIFIVSLPMDEDAITDAIEIETGGDRWRGARTEWLPIEFKNSLEELKHYHNVRMRDRNRYWVYGELIVGGFLGLFLFYIVPKWRYPQETLPHKTELAFGGALVGVCSVLIVPLVIGWVLPAPMNWFPQEIVDIANTREKEALMRLEPLARELDSEGKGNR